MQTPLNDPETTAAYPRLKRWIKRFYLLFHYLLLLLVLAGAGALYLVFRTDSLELARTYLLEPLGIHYTHAEGSLRSGFTLHNLRSDGGEAKTLSLVYSLDTILEGEHIVDSLTIDGLRLHLDDFLSDDASIWPFPTFRLSNVHLTNLQLIGDYPIELDIHAQEGTYDGENLSFASLSATLKSRYADGAITGKVRNNSLSGVADLYPNQTELAPYSGLYTTLPRSLRLSIIELSPTQAILKTTLERLESKHDPLVHAESVLLDFVYRYDNDYFDIDSRYLLTREKESMQTRQHLRYYPSEGKTTTEIDGELSSSYPLPSTLLHGEFTDTDQGVEGRVTLDGSTLHVASKNYDLFSWKLISRHPNLSFIPDLPKTLGESPFLLFGEGNYTLRNENLSGRIEADHSHARFSGTFSTQNGRHHLRGGLELPSDAPLWKNSALKPPKRIDLTLSDENNATRLHLSSDSLALNATLEDEELRGSGHYAGAFFDLSGSFGPEHKTMKIDTLIPSLFATLSHFKPIALHNGEYYDAEIRAETELVFGERVHVRSDIEVPWYAAVFDTKRSYAGTDGSARLTYTDRNITLEKYRLEIADHLITTDKTSRLHLDAESSLVIDELWIFDSLLLRGTLHPDLSASLRLHSDRFRYSGPEGNAMAAADITFERDKEGNQNLSGSLHILDAAITYLPLQEFKVMDDDIIIIQDIRPPSKSPLAMNLRITAEEPIRFQTKELNLLLDPDVTLWKEPSGAMQILGMLTIPSGEATTAGKLFTLNRSEIYFGGNVPINPYLNMAIEHEVDYKKILIYVTHTLESPVFLFSSDPIMSQNDIMSYLLFGGPANSASGGDNSTTTIRADATNFMLGAGIKGLINGATKIQIDTMNILTTNEGGMGFEVGGRLNKDLRILYKNDTVSSVLLQYSINRWLRLDADIHELGQGINAIYIKDFRDFLPHNKPPKK